ncbi:protein kinase [Streptomyces sp. DSM 44915]|uniref:Protein kinase n=1 Tax=Streptomyces chisholmiae TaxID=3075540 RepID=A0ABU2JUH3_9ACTN|nr:protein kinase [Streptomyces sp. DSM 44915]MDT0268595.1 protein kinase [Streptomyces sp. DSM 44915]
MLRDLRAGTPSDVGPYRLLALLGAGGMGEVYLGTARGPAGGESLAAVKTVRREYAVDPEFRARFRREAAAARAVRHPRVARVLGDDAEADRPWLATEYVPGPSLQEAVARGGPLPVPVVRRLGVDLARALAAVHEAGVVHRDVKPGNVLVAADGARLIDFGIARAVAASTLTATGKMLGSPGFMSPEHVAGGRRVTAGSDVFCLGSVLCFAATGVGPFGEAPLAVLLYRIAEGESDLSAVPDDLRETIAACLRADPADRPTPAELAARLAAGADEEAREPVDPRIGGHGLVGDGGGPNWPVPVRELIVDQETAVRRLLAGPPRPPQPPSPGHPGTPPQPTAGPAEALANVPTQAGTGPHPRARADRRRRGAVAGLLTAGLAVLVVAATLWWPRGGDGTGGGDGEADGGPGGTAGTTVLPAAERVTVDALGGPDRRRVFPDNEVDRPADWRAWSGAFADSPLDCALGTSLLVCRLADGTLQALSVADGTPLWRAEPAAGAAAESLGPPALGGALVLSAEGGRLWARNTATGEPYWDSPLPGDRPEPGGRPLAVDGAVFLGAVGDEGVTVAAYALADGAESWRQPMGPAHQDDAGEPVPAVQAYGGGTLYVNGADGLVGLAGESGEEQARDVTGAPYCADGRLFSGYLACRHPADGELAGGFYRLTGEARLELAGDSGESDTLLVPPDGPGEESVRAFGVDTMLTLRDAGEGRELLLHGTIGNQDNGPRTLWPKPGAPADLPVTSPVYVGSRAVFVAGDTLYAHEPADGAEHEVLLPVTGADGEPPLLWAVGGLVCLVWADGTAVSVELP